MARRCAAPGFRPTGELTIEKAGYVTWKDSPLNRSLSTTDAPQEIAVDLVPVEVKVRVQVIDSGSGQPLAGVRLAAKPRGRGNEVSGATSGNGSVELVFPKEGEYTFTLFVADQPPYEEIRTVRAGSPGSPADMVFRLSVANGITIEALVKDARTGAVLPGVAVTGTAGSERGTATTGADGTARIVLTRASGKTASVTCTREGYANGTGSSPVDKGQAKVSVALEPAAGLVRVIIREGKDGKGVAGVTATVSPGDVVGVTGPDGIVELAMPIVPTVSVTCSKGSLPPMKRSCEMVDGKAQMTFLVNIDTVPLKVRVGDKATKAPLQGVKVKAVVNGADFIGSTDADGNLTMEIAAGESVKVYLYKPGYKMIELTRKIEGKLVSVGGTLTPEGTAILQVTLKNRANSQPLSGATVTAGDQTARTNAKGVAEFEVLPGQALQIAAANLASPQQPVLPKKSAGFSIHWRANPQLRRLLRRLQPEAEIRHSVEYIVASSVMTLMLMVRTAIIAHNRSSSKALTPPESSSSRSYAWFRDLIQTQRTTHGTACMT